MKIKAHIARHWIACVCIVLTFSLGQTQNLAQAQEESGLRSDHPDRYVVQEGDTLWDIANRFLLDPWRWPLIWRENEQVENPHLIYPGDVLVVTSDRRIKAVRLKPKTYRQPLDRAIPTIPPHIIQPFLSSAMIVEPGELEQAGYVLSGVEDELIIGKYTHFYGRAITDTTADEYRIFRIGRSISHPETGELLGIEALHLGNARMERAGDDVSKLQMISSNYEVRPQDRILPITEHTPLPYYQPKAPNTLIDGWILYAPQGVNEVGKFDVVIISGGTREGLEEGHVLKAMYHRGTRLDPITEEEYQVPDEESGLMMVFRVFEKLSYALIMDSVRAISLGDRYQSP